MRVPYLPTLNVAEAEFLFSKVRSVAYESSDIPIYNLWFLAHWYAQIRRELLFCGEETNSFCMVEHCRKVMPLQEGSNMDRIFHLIRRDKHIVFNVIFMN